MSGQIEDGYVVIDNGEFGFWTTDLEEVMLSVRESVGQYISDHRRDNKPTTDEEWNELVKCVDVRVYKLGTQSAPVIFPLKQWAMEWYASYEAYTAREGAEEVYNKTVQKVLLAAQKFSKVNGMDPMFFSCCSDLTSAVSEHDRAAIDLMTAKVEEGKH